MYERQFKFTVTAKQGAGFFRETVTASSIHEAMDIMRARYDSSRYHIQPVC